MGGAKGNDGALKRRRTKNTGHEEPDKWFFTLKTHRNMKVL